MNKKEIVEKNINSNYDIYTKQDMKFLFQK